MPSRSEFTLIVYVIIGVVTRDAFTVVMTLLPREIVLVYVKGNLLVSLPCVMEIELSVQIVARQMYSTATSSQCLLLKLL